MKVTLDYISDQIREGNVIDVTRLSYHEGIKEIERIEGGFTIHGVSMENEYLNGVIFRGNETGSLYAYEGLTLSLCALINVEEVSAEYR